ncbi:hypothetical protein [Colwellia sp. MB02u-6]|uniref:hypothetical protein n=1 Tax=Colwellia sp. MB02u-6 TaxID=2759824 RepID=UPI00217566DD|nr:hypothetical protein [Colwellia sp. MB02u-6]
MFSYANIPSRFAAQRKLKDEWLPNADEKWSLMKLAIEKLCNFGYDFTGMYNFAKPGNKLSIAQKSGDLQRKFQGYTTKGSCDLLGLGLSSISAIGHSFSQNTKVLQQLQSHTDSSTRSGKRCQLISRRYYSWRSDSRVDV